MWTAGCGGLMALAVIATGAVRDFCARRKSASGKPRRIVWPAGQREGRTAIPYAPAIAAGVWLSLVGRVTNDMTPNGTDFLAFHFS